MKLGITVGLLVPLLLNHASAADRRDLRGFELGASDIQSAVDHIDNLYCREGHNQEQCIDESDGTTHGQTYFLDFNAEHKVYQVTYSFCSTTAGTKEIVTNSIMPNFRIKFGAQMSDLTTNDTIVFNGVSEGTNGNDFHVALMIRQPCISQGRKGKLYSEIILDDTLKDSK